MPKPTAMLLAVALLGLGIAAAGRAEAGPGTLTMTGTFDGMLDLTPFTAAPFTVVASFRGADLVPSGFGISVYPVTLRFDIGGLGSFTSVAVPNLFAITLGPPFAVANGTYGVELQAPSGALTEFFNVATSFFLPSGDQETLYSSPVSPFLASTPFVVPLVGGSTLTVTGFDDLGDTASLVVPEPGTLALLGLGAVATARLRRGNGQRLRA